MMANLVSPCNFIKAGGHFFHFEFPFRQFHEMFFHRTISLPFAGADKKAGNIVAAPIGGNTVLVSEGELMI